MNEAMIPVDTPSVAAIQQQYRELMQLYDGAIREVRTKLEVLDAEFRVRYARNPIHHLDTRLKSPASSAEKLSASTSVERTPIRTRSSRFAPQFWPV